MKVKLNSENLDQIIEDHANDIYETLAACQSPAECWEMGEKYKAIESVQHDARAGFNQLISSIRYYRTKLADGGFALKNTRISPERRAEIIKDSLRMKEYIQWAEFIITSAALDELETCPEEVMIDNYNIPYVQVTAGMYDITIEGSTYVEEVWPRMKTIYVGDEIHHEFWPEADELLELLFENPKIKL